MITDPKQKILDDLTHYIKWCRMDDSSFYNIEPLKKYMIHKSKNDGEWLLLATCGHMDKQVSEHLRSLIHDNVRFNNNEVEFNTCYLPGDVFLYIKLDETTTESANLNKKEIVLNKALEVLKANGKNPKVTTSEQKKWINDESESSFRDSLCIAGLGNEGLQSVCTKVNAEIKSYGGRLSPDNYGTAFLTIKESEDLTMFDITENKYTSTQFHQFIITCYEAVMNDDNEEDVITEGANLDIREIFKKFKKQYKEEMSKIKKNIKNEKYDESKKGCEKLLEIIKDVKKEVKKIESTTGSVVFGFFTSWSITFLRTFVLCLIPYFGQVIATIMEFIDSWSKPIKKAINHEYLETDDFNAYKNTVESRLENMEKVIKTTIKKIDSLKKEKTEEEKEIKESSEFEDNMSMKFVNENGDLEDARNFMLSLYESIELEDDDDENDTEVTEGVNLKSRRIYKDMKKQIKEHTKKYRKAMKFGQYDKARQALAEIKAIIAKAEKDIRSLESTGFSISIGHVAESLLAITRYIYVLIPIAGPFIVHFKNKKYNLDKLAQVNDNIKKNENVTADIYNEYKNYLLIHINTLKDDIKKLEGLVSNEEKIAKKAALKKAKNDKAVKESAEFATEKLAIYEACNRGEITIEEREELYHNLQDKYYLSEAVSDEETLLKESGLSNKEKFNKVRSVLYERCNNGELTVEERERLIMKAKEKIFSESETPEAGTDKNASKDAEKIAKETEKATQDMEKDLNSTIK